MPTYAEDYLKIQNARNQQGKLNQESADLMGQSSTFNDRVMSKVRERMASSGMDSLSQDYGRVTGQLVSEPAAMRARMSDVNPLQVDALTAKQTGQSLEQSTSIREFQNLRDKNVSEAIGAGTDRLVAAATMKKAEADKAQQEADSLIEMVKLKMDEEKMRFDMAQKGGETDPRDVLAMIMGGQSTNKPQYTPGKGNGAVSNDGKWTWKNGDWKANDSNSDTSNGIGLSREQTQMAVMADPKNASYYMSLYTFMNPEDKTTEAEKAKNDVASLATEALDYLSTKNIKTGKIAAPMQSVKAMFGTADQNTLEFNTKIAMIKASIAKARAGTSFTPNEEKLLDSYTPVTGDSLQQLTTKLNSLNAFFGNKKSRPPLSSFEK